MALTFTLTDVPGMPSPRQKVGQFTEVIKDVVVTSDGNNSDGIVTITAAQLGLTRIFGAWAISADPTDLSSDELAVAFRFNVPVGGANVVMTPRLTDSAVVDLDAAESYGVRVCFRGM